MAEKKYRLLTKGFSYHPWSELKTSDSIKELLNEVEKWKWNICDWIIVNKNGRTIRKNHF